MKPFGPSQAANPSSRGRPVTSFIVSLLAVTVAWSTTAVADPAVGSANRLPSGSGQGSGALATLPTGLAHESEPGIHSVTLLTGDVVRLRVLPSGRMAATFVPSADDPHEGFERHQADDGAYLIPDDAAPYVHSGQVDRELFNLTRLVRQSYGASSVSTLPIIVEYADPPSPESLTRQADALPASRRVIALESIDAAGVSVDKAHAADFWTALAGDVADAPGRQRADLAGDVERVWLDHKVTVDLSESVPRIGTPEAWNAGLDGTGVTVAVLDTGIDATHPDVSGKVVASQSFVPGQDVTDGHGHGTHVAATVAGTGNASDGLRKGVAPGADLVIGKVLSNSGTGPISSVIDGMEWATLEHRVDVVNLSLGTGPTDGTDLASRAVNQLTEQTGAMFVIAAGNNGRLGDSTVTAPGTADAALTVGAVDKADQLADFSGRGPRPGDFAVKPEITAPGVGIVAARAAGTSLGEPVDDLYTSANGTSMATPHVAGAAAILVQQHPDWTPAELKAALVSTADPTDGLNVFQQGAGRVDVARAFSQGVYALESVLNYGVFPWPHDGRKPETRTVTYRNLTDHSVTLDLSLAVRHLNGSTPPSGMVDVAPSSLTLAPGSSGEAVVTLDLTQGDVGTYGATLVATGRDGDVSLRTALSYTKEREMYDVTVNAIGRNGQPAFSGSPVTLWNAASDEWESKDLIGGTATFRVPPGDHAVMAYLLSIDAEGRTVLDATLAGEPELSVTDDTTLSLDAREGKPVVVNTEDVTEHQGVTLGWYRLIGQNDFTSSFSFNLFTDRVFAVPTETVQRGAFEFYTKWDLFAPELRVQALGETDRFDITAEYLTGAPKLDGRRRLPVVHAGLGTPEELAAAEVAGKFALMQRTSALRLAEQITNAADAGAQGAMIFSDRPGKFLGFVGDVPITALSVSQEDGDRLLRQLDGGRVVLDLRGIWPSPLAYDVVLPEQQRIPDALTYRITERDVATVRSTFHGSFAGQPVSDVRFYFRPYDELSVGFTRDFPVPFERTDHVSANDTQWSHVVFADPPFAGEFLSPLRHYGAGQRVSESWLRSPSAPGIPPGVFLPGGGTFAAYREADVLHFDIPEFGDADPDHFGFGESADDTAARLFRDGELIAESPSGNADFEVPSGAGGYRLELDVTRDAPWWTTSVATQTAWTFFSEPPDTGERRLLPLVDVDFHLDLDGLNRALADQPATIDVEVRHQPGFPSPRIDDVSLLASYDDGSTWHAIRDVQRRPGNAFRAWLTHPPLDETSGYVSVRIQADDVDGNAIEQTIVRAYALK